MKNRSTIIGGFFERLQRLTRNGKMRKTGQGIVGYDRLVSELQAVCNMLPDGEIVVNAEQGMLDICVKWNVDDGQIPEARTKVDGDERFKKEQHVPDNEGTGKALEGESVKPAVSKQVNVGQPELRTQPEESVNSNLKDDCEPKACEESRMQAAMRRLNDFMRERYRFRYNVLTEQTEFLVNGSADAEYRPVDRRALNGMALAALDSGVDCWDRDVRRYVESDVVEAYHPFDDYFAHLPRWDGRDRVGELARRVAPSELWVRSFHRWMLGVVAQWTGLCGTDRTNSVAPLLVSTRQGMGKSTFCRLLVPDTLRRYFTESYDLNAQSSAELKLATFGLINIDEFDRLPASRMPLLKNLMQMQRLNVRRAYKQGPEPLRRIASFIGTSNRRDLLTDRTGSRRFVCVEVRQVIDCSPVEHEQLYAQLVEELRRGERCWFSKEEEAAIQASNRIFCRQAPEEEIFNRCFRFATEGEVRSRRKNRNNGVMLMTAAEVFAELKRSNPAAMRGSTCNSLSRLLPMLGRRVHTRYCNGYYLVRR